jgi:leucyl/phenylalanyl-tRNA---protein transferase
MLKKVEESLRAAVRKSLHGRRRRQTLMALKLADDVSTAVIGLGQSVGMMAQPKVSFLRTAPTAPQVLANYTRGLTLFGRSPAFPARFMWRSVGPRAILTQESAKVPRRVRDAVRKAALKVRFDKDFEEIITACQEGREAWVWLTPELVDVYREMHKLGFIGTVGVYRDDDLVAGLWGISVGRVFGIMSMFHRESGTGSLAMAAVSEAVRANERWAFVDCGTMGENFSRYGAVEVPGDTFCEMVWETLSRAPRELATS